MAKTLQFKVERPQKIAAALLLAFLLQCFYVTSVRPLDEQELRTAFVGRHAWSGSPGELSRPGQSVSDENVLAVRAAGLLPRLWQKLHIGEDEDRIYAAPSRRLTRLPFAIFGLWLGAALWWVARRLYGSCGGYVALALFCFSPVIIFYSSTARPEILVAWGIFGLVFTAIGVGHTLYAPARMWRLRILLLGAAIGLTAVANLAAALIGLLFGLAFVLYLAPGRRLIGTAVLALSSIIGAFLCWLSLKLQGTALQTIKISFAVNAAKAGRFISHPSSWIFVLLFVLCLVVYASWPRARYFGNTAPLLAGCLMLFVLPGLSMNQGFPGSKFPVWALPFLCVFVGGIAADLLEDRLLAGRYRRQIAALLFLILVANAVLCIMAAYHGLNSWPNLQS